MVSSALQFIERNFDHQRCLFALFQQVGSVQTRVPLRDKTNFNTDAHAQGSGSGQSASISSILVVQDENTMPSTTSAPSQVAASDPEVSQMTVSLPALSHVTNSVPAEDVQSRTSCFVLPLRACFLSLTTGISPLEISTNSCCIAGYNASLFLGLSEQPQQVQLIVNPDYLRGSAFVTEQKRADLVNNLVRNYFFFSYCTHIPSIWSFPAILPDLTCF